MTTYLNCPYDQKEIAKKNGARWDAMRKKWFYVGDVVPHALRPFLSNGSEQKTQYVNACGGAGCGHRYCDDCRRY